MSHPPVMLEHMFDHGGELRGWDVVRTRLPVDVKGVCDFHAKRITLDADLLEVEARCALAHELLHAIRGPVPANPVLAAREERQVEQQAARRLIPLGALIEALKWSRRPSEVAEALGVDEDMLGARLAGLEDVELQAVEEALGDGDSGLVG